MKKKVVAVNFNLKDIDFALSESRFRVLASPIILPSLLQFIALSLRAYVLRHAQANDVFQAESSHYLEISKELEKTIQEFESSHHTLRDAQQNLWKFKQTTESFLKKMAFEKGQEATRIYADALSQSLIEANKKLVDIYSSIATEACPGGGKLQEGMPIGFTIDQSNLWHKGATPTSIRHPITDLPPTKTNFHNLDEFREMISSPKNLIPLLHQYGNYLSTARYVLPLKHSPWTFLGINMVAQSILALGVNKYGTYKNLSPLETQSLHHALIPFTSFSSSILATGIEFLLAPSVQEIAPPTQLKEAYNPQELKTTFSKLQERGKELADGSKFEYAPNFSQGVQEVCDKTIIPEIIHAAQYQSHVLLQKHKEPSVVWSPGEILVSGDQCSKAYSNIQTHPLEISINNQAGITQENGNKIEFYARPPRDSEFVLQGTIPVGQRIDITCKRADTLYVGAGEFHLRDTGNLTVKEWSENFSFNSSPPGSTSFKIYPIGSFSLQPGPHNLHIKSDSLVYTYHGGQCSIQGMQLVGNTTKITNWQVNTHIAATLNSLPNPDCSLGLPDFPMDHPPSPIFPDITPPHFQQLHTIIQPAPNWDWDPVFGMHLSLILPPANWKTSGAQTLLWGTMSLGVATFLPFAGQALVTVGVMTSLTSIFGGDSIREDQRKIFSALSIDLRVRPSIQNADFKQNETENHKELTQKDFILNVLYQEFTRPTKIWVKNIDLFDLEAIKLKIRTNAPTIFQDADIQFAIFTLKVRIHLNYPEPSSIFHFLLTQLVKNPTFFNSDAGTYFRTHIGDLLQQWNMENSKEVKSSLLSLLEMDQENNFVIPQTKTIIFSYEEQCRTRFGQSKWLSPEGDYQTLIVGAYKIVFPVSLLPPNLDLSKDIRDEKFQLKGDFFQMLTDTSKSFPGAISKEDLTLTDLMSDPGNYRLLLDQRNQCYLVDTRESLNELNGIRCHPLTCAPINESQYLFFTFDNSTKTFRVQRQERAESEV